MVYDYIKLQILTGRMEPGQRIHVESLCKAFEVSRQPVMEALHRLSGEWLVEVLPQVGCRVANYDNRALMELLDGMGDIEAQIAGLAAQRRTPEQLARLKAVTDEICRVEEIDVEGELKLSHVYQHIILEMAHSPVLSRVFEKIWTLGRFAFIVMVRKPLEKEMMQRAHLVIRTITEAITAQDVEAARQEALRWITGLGGWYVSDEEVPADMA